MRITQFILVVSVIRKRWAISKWTSRCNRFWCFFNFYFAYIHNFFIRKTVFCGFVIIMTIALLVTSMVILCLTL